MIVFWVTLLVLQRGYSLVPVVTVELEKSVTITCVLPAKKDDDRKIRWYKQADGDDLQLIATVWKFKTMYQPDFSEERQEVKADKTFTNLTFYNTIREDKGMYHCGVTDRMNTKWSGTYLLVKDSETLNYSVVQSSSFSGPVHPGHSVSLQCSVLSDSKKTCPGGHSVYWIRTGSDKSGPGIIYTDVNDECEQRSDSVKSCVYRFSKNVSSSDAGTYYCAVASCGHILFGDGTELNITCPSIVQTTESCLTVVVILTVFLAVSVIGNVVFLIYNQTLHRKSKVQPGFKKTVHEISEDENKLNYAALDFSEREQRGRKKRDTLEFAVYSHVK